MRPSPARTRAIALFAACFVLLALVAALLARHDPTSLFFRASPPVYSALRRQQAQAYIERAAREAQPQASASKPTLCLAINSVARGANASYLEDAIGSLLDGLHSAERAQVHLQLLLAHADPQDHPAHGAPWLANVVDTLLTYDPARVDINHVKEMEAEHGLFREKGLLDYTYALDACLATQAEYIAMVEDDVVALDGWFHRTVAALALLRSKEAPAEDDLTTPAPASGYLYLRLFWTETYLGWNSEEWGSYLFYSLGVLAVFWTALSLLHCVAFGRHKLNDALHPKSLSLYALVFLPMLILLYFATGRATVQPMRAPVALMNNFGCCSQGLVFPRQQAPGVLGWLRDKRVGFVDMLIEELAASTGQDRYAIVPSVLQHTGTQSSKQGTAEVTTWIWNYGFEQQQEKVLDAEHRVAFG